MMIFTQQAINEFIGKLAEQLILVGLATGAAIVIGIPLGIFVLRYPRCKRLVIGLANILQTIPSLALLAFLLPILGIGIKPAVVTISLYCLLPLVRNTILGLEGIPAEVNEAATALGFSFWQKLYYIELPLALPVIIAGVRIAVVMAVGIATLAAFIGAGGLGDYITQGLALNNHALILLGAIPAAILALLCDRLISFIETTLQEKQLSFKKIGYMFGSVFCIITACVIFGGSKACFQTQNEDTIRVASKNFTEEFILAELMAEMIEAKTNLHVTRQFNLGTTDIVHQSMIKGDTDLYPEYTGTAYLTVLNKSTDISNQSMFDVLNNEYQTKYHLTWLEPFRMNNSNALLVTDEFSKRYHVTSISDLTRLTLPLVIASPAEFIKRADGYPGLQNKYQLHFTKVIQMDPALLYQSMSQGQVNVSVGFTTDGRIKQYHLVPLTDDKHFYPPYQAAPVIRSSVLKKHPEIKQALEPLVNLINNETMAELNAEVDIKKMSPQAVAHEFLVRHALISLS